MLVTDPLRTQVINEGVRLVCVINDVVGKHHLNINYHETAELRLV